jgi:uncharacterized sulfatase
MKRRSFLKSTAAVAGGSLLNNLGVNRLLAESKPDATPGTKPNILFILVDELRYPSAFPSGVNNADEFFCRFMPKLHRHIWQPGVKLGNYHTAANACTPARGVIITGLYSQQNWLISTILASPTPAPIARLQPVLNAAFPTYGSLMRKIGFQTPYRGKWHVSLPVPFPKGTGLERYGFEYNTYPDPTGYNLQGTYGEEPYYHNDAYTARQAADFLGALKPGADPFCLTVGFINPHDREFFPAGTEFKTVNDAFASNPNFTQSKVYPGSDSVPGSGPYVTWDENKLKTPPSYGYPTVPPNWESSQDWIDRKKPRTQCFIKKFSNLTWGGVTDDSTQTEISIDGYETNPSSTLGVIKMPFSYWQRGLDSYTQIIQALDEQIGTVLDALHSLPQDVIDNTVIVFASDHGEYAGAHGLIQGKLGTVYEEAWRIPLIVVDPQGRYTREVDDIRMGLASSVDLTPMLVTIANGGSTSWLTPTLRKIYGNRHDMFSMLKCKDAPGRSFVLHATDEVCPDYFNPSLVPTHVLGYRTDEYKLGVYANWDPSTSNIALDSLELEFYDYSTESGRMELDSTPEDPRVQPLVDQLIERIIPGELQQALPAPFRAIQQGAQIAHLKYRDYIESQAPSLWENGGLHTALGYGGDF